MSSGSPAPVPGSASLASDTAFSARGASAVSIERTSMRFCVSVPVLSVAITVTDPSASTADSRRTTARRFTMRSTPSASATVSTAGSPSGTAATASATAKMSSSPAWLGPSASRPSTPSVRARPTTHRAT